MLNYAQKTPLILYNTCSKCSYKMFSPFFKKKAICISLDSIRNSENFNKTKILNKYFA